MSWAWTASKGVLVDAAREYAKDTALTVMPAQVTSSTVRPTPVAPAKASFPVKYVVLGLAAVGAIWYFSKRRK